MTLPAGSLSTRTAPQTLKVLESTRKLALCTSMLLILLGMCVVGHYQIVRAFVSLRFMLIKY